MKYNFPKLPLISSILFFIVSSSLFAFLYVRINKNNVSSETMQQAWQVENAAQEDLRSLDSSLKGVEPERALLETHFAKSSDVVPFLDMIETLAAQPGAKAEVTLVNVLDDGSGLMVSIKALGSFEAVYKFLRLLENSPYEMEIVAVDMQKTNVDTKGSTLDQTSADEWVANISIKLLSFIK